MTCCQKLQPLPYVGPTIYCYLGYYGDKMSRRLTMHNIIRSYIVQRIDSYLYLFIVFLKVFENILMYYSEIRKFWCRKQLNTGNQAVTDNPMSVVHVFVRKLFTFSTSFPDTNFNQNWHAKCFDECLFVCLRFSFISRIFHSFGDVTITGERLQILIFSRHLWPLSSEGS